MSTNAQHHDFSMLAEAFKTGVLGRLVVSCDGDGSQESYEQLRPPAKWGRLLEFLAKAKELRDKYAPSMHLMTRTIAPSDDHRKRWSSLLKPLGWEPEFRDWNIFPDALENRSNREAIPGRGVCGYVLAGKFYVKTDGTVVPCCAHPQAYRLGNLKMQTYSEIMNGELRRKFLHELRTARHKMPVCGKCVSGTGKC